MVFYALHSSRSTAVFFFCKPVLACIACWRKLLSTDILKLIVLSNNNFIYVLFSVRGFGWLVRKYPKNYQQFLNQTLFQPGRARGSKLASEINEYPPFPLRAPKVIKYVRTVAHYDSVWSGIKNCCGWVISRNKYASVTKGIKKLRYIRY